MAEWFGLDDAICPHEIGLDGPHEKLFPCFAGMPQGWTWALYFCQSAVQHCGERALGPGRALVHGRPAPDLLAGPVCSTYVDNIMCLTQPGQGAQVYAQVRTGSSRRDFRRLPHRRCRHGDLKEGWEAEASQRPGLASLQGDKGARLHESCVGRRDPGVVRTCGALLRNHALCSFYLSLIVSLRTLCTRHVQATPV